MNFALQVKTLPPMGASRKAIFYRCFATLFGAGVHIGDCLASLAQQAEDPRLKATIVLVQQQVMGGLPLSRSLQRQPLFRGFEADCLAAGEAGGFLHRALEGLANHWEQVSRLQRHLQSQLLYPFFVVVLSVATVAFLPSLLHRSLEPMLLQSGAQMPPLTRALSAFTAGMGNPKLWLLAGLALAGALTYLRRLPAQSHDRWLRSLPLLGGLWRSLASIWFLRTLEMTLEAGLPVLLSLPTAAAASGSPLLQQAAAGAVSDLKEGLTLTEALQRAGLVPEWLTGFLSAGEHTGKLPSLLRRAAQMLEDDLMVRIEQTLALLQPAVLAFLGGMIGIFALGVLLPISKVLETL